MSLPLKGRPDLPDLESGLMSDPTFAQTFAPTFAQTFALPPAQPSRPGPHDGAPASVTTAGKRFQYRPDTLFT